MGSRSSIHPTQEKTNRRKSPLDSGRPYTRIDYSSDLTARYPKRNFSLANQSHKVYPYRLRDLVIDRPNQVWASDVTSIPMARGFVYRVAIMDWHSRKVPAWRVSNTLDARFCVEALEEAIAFHGVPEIFNTDQGSQFTRYCSHEI